MTLTDYMCQKKEEKEDLPALKIVLTSIQWLEDYIENAEELDSDIQSDHLISARRPNLIIINKKKWNLPNCGLGYPG